MNENKIEKIDETMPEGEVPEIPKVDPDIDTTPAMVGIVSDCSKLNIRKIPNKTSEVVSIIPEGTEVVIDVDKSTEAWYAICTASGIEGFCMKDYITIQ